MEQTIAADDVLFANAGYSRFVFGPRLPGRKIMYVQGFTTYRPLDLAYDAYVCVSSFVQRFLKNVYGVDAPLIAPFVELAALPPAAPWDERRPGSIVVHVKDSEYTSSRCSRRCASVPGRLGSTIRSR